MPLEGIADLPLHWGHVPPWLIVVMRRMARAILEIMVEEFGPDRVVYRFSNPLWFQAFNNIIGMDWDSSGSTTVTMGILKDVTWSNPGLGLLVLGGKGRSARRVPEEAITAGEILGLSTRDVEAVTRASRLIAKIDSALLQDGYTLYHHTLLVSERGAWSIIQQGMNTDTGMARRYHWLPPRDYYNNPHSAVAGVRSDVVINLVSPDSRAARKTMLDLARSDPGKTLSMIGEALRMVKGLRSITEYILPSRTGRVGTARGAERIVLYRPVRIDKSLIDRLNKLYEAQPAGMDELLLVRGVGPKTIRALVLVSDLIYNEPPSTADPVDTPYDPFQYAYAIGGKDGVPYPVDRRQAEEVISILESIVENARLGDKERMRAFRNLGRLKIRFFGRHSP